MTLPLRSALPFASTALIAAGALGNVHDRIFYLQRVDHVRAVGNEDA